MKKILIFSLAIIALACGRFSSSELSEQQALWDEVMKVHDEVMPKMGLITNAEKELKVAAKELPENLNASEIDEIQGYLTKSEEEMWTWMHDLQKLEDLQANKTHEEIIEYLNEQKKSIDQVKFNMELSVKKANKMVELIKQSKNETAE